MATRIDHEDIWKALRPHLPMLRTIVKDNRDEDAFAKFHPNEPNKEPELNWVFMRKYSPSDKRNSLKPHQDTNMYTLNIELNDDYEGGGWLYVKPPNNAAAAGKEYVHADGVHHIPVEYMNYEWTNGLVRENNTEIVFPTLLTGDGEIRELCWCLPKQACLRLFLLLLKHCSSLPIVMCDLPP